MAFQQVVDTVEIRTIYDIANDPFMMTYHARLPGGYVQADLDALAASIDGTAVVGLLAHQSAHMEYIQTEVRGLDVINDLSAIDATSTAFGDVISATLPSNVAYVVARRSGLSGRSARGRVFIGGIPTSYMQTSGPVDNFLLQTASDDYEDDIDIFRNTIDVITGWEPVIVSRYTDKTKRMIGITFDWLTTTTTSLKVNSRRKRLG